jgi:hypothetical protein
LTGRCSEIAAIPSWRFYYMTSLGAAIRQALKEPTILRNIKRRIHCGPHGFRFFHPCGCHVRVEAALRLALGKLGQLSSDRSGLSSAFIRREMMPSLGRNSNCMKSSSKCGDSDFCQEDINGRSIREGDRCSWSCDSSWCTREMLLVQVWLRHKREQHQKGSVVLKMP